VRDVVKADEGEIYDIELSKDLIEENERIAIENKSLLGAYGIKTIDVMGSIGTGKTTLISSLVQKLKGKYRIAAIAGDLTTTIDADLIARHGVEVVQINTGKECHLDANLVRKAIRKIDLSKINLLFIENVGNLICPAEFPLGSDSRIVVISLTEGPNIVVKHPFVFINSDIVVINKMDLIDVLDVDVRRLERDINEINPKIRVVKASCKNGTGIMETIEALEL